VATTSLYANYTRILRMIYKVTYSFILTLSIIGLILPGISLAQIEAPKSPDEVKDFLFQVIKPLPEAFQRAWQEALTIWQRMLDFFTNLWDLKVKPWFLGIWQQISAFFGKELEKKETMIREEIEKEKEEIKKEIPKVGKNIWERLKGLIGR